MWSAGWPHIRSARGPRSLSRARVAADTGQNFLRSRLDQLAHVMRIGMEGAGQRNVLEAFFLHDCAGEFRIIEPLRDTYRDAVADNLSDCGCILARILPWETRDPETSWPPTHWVAPVTSIRSMPASASMLQNAALSSISSPPSTNSTAEMRYPIG